MIEDNAPLQDLPLWSERTRRVCADLDLKTIDDLANCTASYLLSRPNCGPMAMSEIRDMLRYHGRSLKGDEDRPPIVVIEVADDTPLRQLVFGLDGTPMSMQDCTPLSVRSWNALLNDNILTIGELAKKTVSELLRIPNFGRKSLNEVEEFLARHGRKLVN